MSREPVIDKVMAAADDKAPVSTTDHAKKLRELFLRVADIKSRHPAILSLTQAPCQSS